MKIQFLLFFLCVFSLLSCSQEENLDTDPIGSTDTNSETPSVTASISGFTACENGFAGEFPCSNIDLYAHLDLNILEATSGNDNWGWTDPETGKEYVLVGLDNGTAFVDISQPETPLYLGKLPSATDASSWRDVKVYQNHAYIVSEAPQHGLQVFDLTRLRAVMETGQTFTADSRNTSFGNAHNIAINEETGFAYVLGSQLENGGPVFFDLSDPKNPRRVGGYRFNGYAHDAQIISYQGPDTAYQGKEIYMGSHSDGSTYNDLVILDVTHKESPILLQALSYGSPGYTHQNWISEDHRYVFLGDEVDEISFGGRTRTLVFDVSDLNQGVLHHIYRGPTEAIDHNGYVKEGLYYLANYTAGLRIVDVASIENNRMGEVGFFDTYAQNNHTAFEGVWNVYPFFESGIIAINDINTGLYLVKQSEY